MFHTIVSCLVRGGCIEILLLGPSQEAILELEIEMIESRQIVPIEANNHLRGKSLVVVSRQIVLQLCFIYIDMPCLFALFFVVFLVNAYSPVSCITLVL